MVEVEVQTLGTSFLEAVARHAERTALIDANGSQLTYAELGRRCVAFGHVLDGCLDGAAHVGVLLPPGEWGVVANVALALIGRASVNLNYSLGSDALLDPARQAGLTRVITSRRFLKLVKVSSPLDAERTLFVEDLAPRMAAPDPAPSRRVGGACSASDTATVIFSSGSTALPKGVALSHANILANVEGVASVFGFSPRDCMLGVLPFFHSFGYTVTIWTPLLRGASVVYHPDPLDSETIGRLCQKHSVSVTLATPALYQTWMRRIAPEQLASVRAAVVGAQRLPTPLADAWRGKYGQDLFEGYGCTELSPVVAANAPDCSRLGTVGRALPNVEIEVRDPDSGESLPCGQEGLIWVRGPNVMCGYLERPDETRAVLRDGWYDTGDIGRLDQDGFLAITDRRSRFTKIAGEMVPHGRVEEALEQAALELGSADLELAVTSIPDEARGERLCVVHTPLGVEPETLLARAKLPRIFKPRPDAFVGVESLPRLGTGKLDLRALRRIAQDASSA